MKPPRNAGEFDLVSIMAEATPAMPFMRRFAQSAGAGL
jgi:hypothetical protein